MNKVLEDLPPLLVNGQALKVVDNAKLLGLTISSNLTWNEHMSTAVEKAAKRLCFLKQLKRSSVPKAELVSFYITCIRSVCDYAIPVFHSSLPEYYSVKDLERVQKRALAIVCPNQTYSDALLSMNVESLEQHHHHLSQSLFNSIEPTIEGDISHRLHKLLPPLHKFKYNLRRSRTYDVSFKTNKAKRSFFNFYCI